MSFQSFSGGLEILWNIFVESITESRYQDKIVINGVIFNCTTIIPYTKYVELYTPILSVILILIFCMLEKRRSYKKESCSGRFGLPIPSPLLSDHKHMLPFVVVFLSVSERLHDILTTKSISEIPILMFLKHLMTVVLLNLVYYPIFVALHSRILAGYILGLIGAIFYFLITIFTIENITNCHAGTILIPLIIDSVIPTIINFILVVIFVQKIIRHIRLIGWHLLQELPVIDDKTIKYQEYVRHLLKIRTHYECNTFDKKSRMKAVIKKFKYKAYEDIPGFSMPPKLMIGIVIGLYLAWKIFIKAIVDMTPFLWNFIGNLREWYTIKSNLTLRESFSICANSTSYNETQQTNAFGYLFTFYVHLILTCLVWTLVLGLFHSVLISFLIVRNYRRNFHKMVKHGLSVFLKKHQTPPPYELVLGFVKYTGYQASFILWGIVVFIIVMFIAEFIFIGLIFVPLFYVENSIIWQTIKLLLPVILVTVVIDVGQILLVRFVFMKERGRVMQLNNQRFFIIYNHFMIFFNALIGIFTSLVRGIVWIIMLSLTFARIDICVLPNYVKQFDSGFMSYVGFIYTEIYHHHPILRCFVGILLNSKEDKSLELNVTNNSVNQTLSNSPINKKYRNKWFLAYTLINNPKLIYLNDSKINID